MATIHVLHSGKTEEYVVKQQMVVLAACSNDYLFQIFEQYLIDSDYSMNAGNWMWLSASAFSHHYTKIFHPVKFGKRTDSTGEYVR